MKKKFIALLLVTLMLFSGVLTSCSDTVDIVDTPAKVYTLYTIAEEGTTQEGIRATELALNRLVFYRLGFLVKLVMVPEAEYDQLIEDKLAELAEYEANKKGGPPLLLPTATPKPPRRSSPARCCLTGWTRGRTSSPTVRVWTCSSCAAASSIRI